MAKFKQGQIVIYKDEPDDLYSIKSVLEFPGSATFYSIWKIGSNEAPEITIEEHLTLAQYNIKKEDNTMGPINTKDVFYSTYFTGHDDANKVNEDPEVIEYEKKCKELRDEAEKKILDIRKELALALQKLDQERKDAERVKREQTQAKIWKTKYDTLVEAGFTSEQAWEMTMKSFEID